MAAADRPRAMSLPARLSLLFGPGYFLGMLVGGFGLLFVAIFAPHRSIGELIDFRGKLANEAAVVTGIEKTNMTENDRRIRRVTAEFEHAGRGYEIASYRLRGGPKIGEAARVEFPVGDPTGARLVNHRRAPWPAMISFLFLFPAAGLATAVSSFRGGLRRIRHYRDGAVALGTVTSRDRTGVEINDKPVYKYGYRFRDEAGREVTGTHRTHEYRTREYRTQSADHAVLLTYLPWSPTRVRFVANPRAAPDGLRIDEFGTIGGGSTPRVVAGVAFGVGLTVELAVIAAWA